MNKLAELLGLRAQIAELENEINNESITFTKEELIEFTKTISNAVANGVKFELSPITYTLGYSFMDNKTTASELFLWEASWYYYFIVVCISRLFWFLEPFFKLTDPLQVVKYL